MKVLKNFTYKDLMSVNVTCIWIIIDHTYSFRNWTLWKVNQILTLTPLENVCPFSMMGSSVVKMQSGMIIVSTDVMIFCNHLKIVNNKTSFVSKKLYTKVLIVSPDKL